MLTNLLFLVSSALCAAAEGVSSLFLARLYQGIAVGLATVCVPMYISEFTPDSSRGFYGTLHQLLVTVGILVGTLLGLAFGTPPSDSDLSFKVSLFQQVWWRFMLAFPALVSISGLLLLWLVYTTESPHYLMQQGKKNTATALLKEILGKEDVTQEIQTIEVGICQQKVLAAESLSLRRAMTYPVYRHVLLLSFFLSGFQQLTGINILVSNSNKLYTSLGISTALVTGLSVAMNFINVLMTVPAIFLMDRLGRRTLLVGGVFGQGASTLIALIANLVDRESVAVQWLTVACIFVYVIFFAVGYGPVLWVYLHEIFPPEIKQTGASVASAINAICTICVVLPSDFVLTSDMRGMLGLCAGTSLLGFIVSFVFMKETAGLSIDESPYFKGKRRVMSKYFDATGLNDVGQPVPSLASASWLLPPPPANSRPSGGLSAPEGPRQVGVAPFPSRSRRAAAGRLSPRQPPSSCPTASCEAAGGRNQRGVRVLMRRVFLEVRQQRRCVSSRCACAPIKCQRPPLVLRGQEAERLLTTDRERKKRSRQETRDSRPSSHHREGASLRPWTDRSGAALLELCEAQWSPARLFFPLSGLCFKLCRLCPY
ncbi:hypothetical protein Efla_003186 [Eimeria flavescens]